MDFVFEFTTILTSQGCLFTFVVTLADIPVVVHTAFLWLIDERLDEVACVKLPELFLFEVDPHQLVFDHRETKVKRQNLIFR